MSPAPPSVSAITPEDFNAGRGDGFIASAPEALWVEALDGPSVGAKTLLRAGTVTVGSASDCDLVLRDPAVSGHHLSVGLLAGAVQVQDLSSRNGTHHRGARIEMARVLAGGSVRIGATHLHFAPSPRELHGLHGDAFVTRRLFATLEGLGPTQTSVLLRGEIGTGKDTAARALHALSPRAAHPFLGVDCASVPVNQMESVLFGRAKDASSGAGRVHLGAAEAAGEGTLFLDEVGELSLEAQSKLHSLLATREFSRLGMDGPRKFCARVLSATHRNLESAVQEGRFRADLYGQLAGAVVELPALRERPEDIPLLALHFAKSSSGHPVTVRAMTRALLQSDPWPGNVRELRSAVRRAVTLGARDDSSERPMPTAFTQARQQLMQHLESDYLRALMMAHDESLSAAARDSGLSRGELHRLLERHGIKVRGEG